MEWNSSEAVGLFHHSVYLCNLFIDVLFIWLDLCLVKNLMHFCNCVSVFLGKLNLKICSKICSHNMLQAVHLMVNLLTNQILIPATPPTPLSLTALHVAKKLANAVLDAARPTNWLSMHWERQRKPVIKNFDHGLITLEKERCFFLGNLRKHKWRNWLAVVSWECCTRTHSLSLGQ